MQEQLVELARNKGFKGRNNLIIVNDDYWYLYLCELQKWLREKHNLHTYVIRDWDGWSYQLFEFSKGNKFIKGGGIEMPDYHIELEKVLFEALKLIK